MNDASVHEIDLEKTYLSAGEDMSFYLAGSDPGERVTLIADVVRRMEEAWGRGARVILLSIDSFGGSFQAGVSLLRALDGWRLRGGRVVTFLAGMAGSSASWFFLPSDYVVAHQRSTILIHGSVATGTGGEATTGDPAIRAEIRSLKEWFFKAGTTATAEEIYRWISTPGRPDEGGTPLDAREARRLNFVDEIGGRMRAGEVARRFVEGKPVRSHRQEAIAPRLQVLSEGLGSVPAGMDGFLARRVVETSAIGDGAITVGKFSADAVRTQNYAEDGSGNPTAGAKLDTAGTAVKVAPGNLQLGDYFLSGCGRVISAVGCTVASGSYSPWGQLDISGIARVDRGASFYPRYALRVTFDTNLGGKISSCLVCPWQQSSYSGAPFQVHVCGVSANTVDIGFASAAGVWQDPASITAGFLLYRVTTH